eukprot:Nk52_evm44s2152 gene=Nk52_evmTU44s2152
MELKAESDVIIVLSVMLFVLFCGVGICIAFLYRSGYIRRWKEARKRAREGSDVEDGDMESAFRGGFSSGDEYESWEEEEGEGDYEEGNEGGAGVEGEAGEEDGLAGDQEGAGRKKRRRKKKGRKRKNHQQGERLDGIPPNFVVKFENLEVSSILGRGSYGVVYKGLFRGTTVAVKKLIKQQLEGEIMKEFEREITILCTLRHPNIVLFMGVSLEPPNCAIITEFLPRGNLHQVLQDPSIRLSLSYKVHMGIDICKGMNYLHASNPPIFHRDLKSPNLLVDQDFHIKVSDFGLTKFKETEFEQQQGLEGTSAAAAATGGGVGASSSPAGKAARQGEAKFVGSIYWTAPEILRNQEYTEKADVYSFGIIMWELFTRKELYKDMHPVSVGYRVMKRGLRPELNEDIPDGVRELIAKCWDEEPEERPNFGSNIRFLTDYEIPQNHRASMASSDAVMLDEMHLDEEPPEGLCALVYCQLAHGPYLFEACPVEMKEVVKTFLFELRVILKKCNGYEASCDEGGMLVLFKEAKDALMWCVTVQERLMEITWPDKVLSLKLCRESFDSRGNLMFRGPRVQMGVHYGDVEQFYDTLEKRVTYAGLRVDETYGIHDICPGGNIVASHTAWREIAMAFEDVARVVSVKDLGQCDILIDNEGNEYSQFLCLIVPNSLVSRYLEPAYSPSSPRYPGGTAVGLQQPPRSPRMPQSPHSPLSTTASVSSGKGMDPLSSWQIMPECLVVEDKPFSVVPSGAAYKAVWNDSVDVSATKLNRSSLTENLKIDLMSEIYLRSQLRHPNINTFYGAVLEPEVIMVTEWCDKGPLRGLVYDSNVAIDYRKRLGMVNDVARAMYYLHSHKPTILHCNLSARCVMVSGDFNCKVGDFANACIKYDEQGSVTDLSYWSAPEIVTGDKNFSEASDVFNFGLLMYEIICRRYPCDPPKRSCSASKQDSLQEHNSGSTNYKRKSSAALELVGDMIKGYRPEIPACIPPKCRALVEACWQPEDGKRPTMQVILQRIAELRVELDNASENGIDVKAVDELKPGPPPGQS